MTSNAVERVHPAPLPAPSHIGQATAVEQSRAVAEVQAAIVVAQQCPRNIPTAISAMREACKQRGLAERAFFRFPRAGSTVTGPSVYLARELARCWGNIQYGIAELRRDDDAGFSEMQAFAWDVQTNTRSTQVFVVPHKRDRRDRQGNPEQAPLVDMRDIYENNANQGSRRLREAIFSVLPVWFTEEAKVICNQTLQDGGGRPLAQRVADAVDRFGGLGVSVGQLEQRTGRLRSEWTEHDLAQLHVAFTSLQRGEISKDDEFPPERVTAAEVSAANGVPVAPVRLAEFAPAAEARPVSGQPANGGRAAGRGKASSAGSGEWPEVAQPAGGGS